MARSRNWVFTLNNYTDTEVATLKEWTAGNCKYVGWGEEVGESGTPHLQGVIIFQNAVRLGTVKRLLPRAHIEVMRGTFAQARDYCMKDGKYYSWGMEPVGQGARSDVKSITESIKAGMSKREILEEHGDKALRMFNCITSAQAVFHEVKKNWVMDVRIYWGPPGVGKTRAVYDEFGLDNVYEKPLGKWWTGYKGETCVIIDDFDPEDCFDIQFNFYLKLLDRYPTPIEWKNGGGQFYSKVIIFTSNFDPETWFLKRPNRAAFFRRVTATRRFDTDTDTEVREGNTVPLASPLPSDPLSEWLSGCYDGLV